MKLFQKRTIPRRTTLISVGLTALLVGLFLAYKNIHLTNGWLVSVLPLSFLIYRFKKIRLPCVIALGLLVGVWRGSVVFTDLQKYQPHYGSKNVFIGVVADDPGFNGQRNQTEFTITDIKTSDQDLIGRILVGVRESPGVGRGDVVQVFGKLKSVKGTSRQGSISMAEVKVLEQNSSWLEGVRAKFFASVQRALPEQHASLGLGYLVGLRANIPQELSDQMKIVGLTHIIAVSGYNLTVIVQAVRRIFAKRSAYQAVFFTSLLLGGFLLVAGGSAPIIRAAVVCGFSLLAWYYGRVVKPLVLLLLSGGLTAFASSLYVWGDPGWYLSFLAFAGVLILAPLVVKFLYPNKQPGMVSQIFIETICAQAATIPYTLYLFGSVSVIAPLANLFVLPLIPVIMLMVFLIGILGTAVPGLAAVLGLLPSSLLTLQIWIIEKLSTVSFASSEISITLPVMIALFACLVALVVILIKVTGKSDAKRLQELDYNLL